MAPQLTPAQREQIITLSNNGCGVSDIQKRTGIARKTVYFWLRRYEETGGDLIAYRREFDYRATTAAQDAAIIAAHRNEPSRSTKDTASEFNVSRETVRRRIKESLGHRKPKMRKHIKRVVDQNALPVTEKQLEVLVEFAERNLDLALSCHLKGSVAAVETQNAWKELTLRLNSLPGGINKTAERWRRYWIDVKSKIRNKANSQRFLELSCGTPSPLEISCGPYDIPLSADLEERVLAIIRQGAGYKSPTIEIPAFALPDTSSQSSTSPRLSPSKQDDTPSEIIQPTPTSPETRNSSASSPETEDPNPLPSEVKKHYSSSPDAARDCLPEPKVEMEWLENLANSSIPKKEHEVWTVIPPAPAIAHDNHGGRGDWTLPEHVPRWAVELEERRAATEERLTAAVESISNNLNQIAANVKELLRHVKK